MVKAFRYTKYEAAVRFTEILEEKFEDGAAWNCLSCVATSSLEFLLFRSPVSAEVQILEFLGAGHSSTVYSGIYKREKVVVKVCSPNCIQHEKKILNELKNIANVPKFVGECEGALLVKPVANTFSYTDMTKEHISQLVEVLKYAHSNNIVHRDVRAPNMFITDQKTALLNDWGSACEGGVNPLFEGGLLEASSSILDSLIPNTPVKVRPEDDLHALARCMYLISRQAAPPLTSKPPSAQQLSQIKTFWQNRSGRWKEIFQMAENKQYDDFAKALIILTLDL